MDTEWWIFIGNSAREFVIFYFLFRAFSGLQFKVTLRQDQKFREVYLIEWLVSFVPLVYKICIYCLLKARLVFQRCRCVFILYLAFFGAIWLFHGLIWHFLLMTTWQTCFLGCLSLRVPSRSQLTNLGLANLLTFSEQKYLVFDTASQHKVTRNARNLGEMVPLAPCIRLWSYPWVFFSGRRVVFVFAIITLFRRSSYSIWSNGLVNQ